MFTIEEQDTPILEILLADYTALANKTADRIDHLQAVLTNLHSDIAIVTTTLEERKAKRCNSRPESRPIDRGFHGAAKNESATTYIIMKGARANDHENELRQLD